MTQTSACLIEVFLSVVFVLKKKKANNLAANAQLVFFLINGSYLKSQQQSVRHFYCLLFN
jgi:hypothetical protein